MFGKRNIRITIEGLSYLLVLAFILGGAMIREIGMLFIMAGMMIGPMLYNWQSVSLCMSGLSIRRRVPQSICAGDLLVVDLEATNKLRWYSCRAVVVEDQVRRVSQERTEKPNSVSALFSSIDASSQAVGNYRGRLDKRGRYLFGPLRISSSFPLGLVKKTIINEKIDSIIVCPRLGQLTPEWTKLTQLISIGSQATHRQQGLSEGDYYGLRDWRPGDSQRWIHWRTTARKGSLTVRQFERPTNLDLALLLDLWQPTAPNPEQLDYIEQATSFAGTVVAELCRSGGSRLIVSHTGKHPATTAGNASMILLQEMMEQLAEVEGGDEDLLPQMIQTAFKEVTPGTKIILVTTRPVDLYDTERFEDLWNDHQQRNRIEQIKTIDISSGQLSRYFQI